MTIRRPMLAGKADLKALKYPCLVTPKLDGIRALKLETNGPLLSRNFKPIPNREIQKRFRWLPNGVDGELVIPSTQFNEISSAVMGEYSDTSKVEYWIFDWFGSFQSKKEAYQTRINSIANGLPQANDVSILIYHTINNEDELLEYEKQVLQDGYEGVMIRSPNGPYKEGRSTTREGYLLKLKRFKEDCDGIILGFEELMINNNPQIKNELGLSKRSSHKANKIPGGILGKVIIRDLEDGRICKVGSGFTDSQRKEIWEHKELYINKIIKYKHQVYGEVEKQRIPIFLGFRS